MWIIKGWRGGERNLFALPLTFFFFFFWCALTSGGVAARREDVCTWNVEKTETAIKNKKKSTLSSCWGLHLPVVHSGFGCGWGQVRSGGVKWGQVSLLCCYSSSRYGLKDDPQTAEEAIKWSLLLIPFSPVPYNWPEIKSLFFFFNRGTRPIENAQGNTRISK